MSQINSFNPFGWFGGWGGIFRKPQQIEAPATKPDDKPSDAPRTGNQQNFALGFGAVGGIAVNMGGATFGYYGGGKGFIQPPRGFYSTYRAMALNPSIVMVRSAVTDPIRANKWNIVGEEKDTPKEWIDEVKAQVLPQRHAIIAEALRFLDYGWMSFEKRWSIAANGRRKIALKPLLVDLTTIYVDPFGEFAGVRNGAYVRGQADTILSPQYSLVLTHDGEAGNLYGLSRMEAAYETFCDWQLNRLDAIKLRGKLSGIQPILHYPVGVTNLIIEGVVTPMDNSIVAQAILAQLGLGNGVCMPSQEFSLEAIEQNPKLASTSLWTLDFMDAGGLATAQDGYIKAREYDDTLLGRAWRCREDSWKNSGTGNRATAGVHTDSNTVDPENIDADIAESLNRQWVDDILVYNFGEDARGAVRIEPQPLSNPTIEFKQQLATALAVNPEFVANLDIPASMKDVELPVLDKPKPIVLPTAPGGTPPKKKEPDDVGEMLSRWTGEN